MTRPAHIPTLRADIQDTAVFQEAFALYQLLRNPSSGRISDIAELSSAPDGSRGLFSATIVDSLEGVPTTRIAAIDFKSGKVRVLTSGPNVDRLPKFSPEGGRAAFLSDREKAGDAQLYLLDVTTGQATPAPHPDGWIEYYHWSPDGTRILMGVAGYGADVSSNQGATTKDLADRSIPEWVPDVRSTHEKHGRRRAWIYDLESGQLDPVGPRDLNIWEVQWCGDDAIIAAASPGAAEGRWYHASLYHIAIGGGAREIFQPEDQIGWPSASIDGRSVAVVAAACSDRWSVAGDLKIIDVGSGSIRPIDTLGVDITFTEWQRDGSLLVAGHRYFESVVGVVDPKTEHFDILWRSEEVTGTPRYMTVSVLADFGHCAMILEGFTSAPEIGVLENGTYRLIASFDAGYSRVIDAIGAIEQVRWKASDGLEIGGWLLQPATAAPHPTVMWLHGGPVAHWRPRYLGRWNISQIMLLRRGYAIFLPNPRGSSGRGQWFARQVIGDMGGADAQDLLAGLDYLVDRGLADRARLGVTGASYGGYLTSWLVTQDNRFAAAVSLAPATNRVTARLLSNIPEFMDIFVSGSYVDPESAFFTRSPVRYARNATTPTLNICGALDRCTPPEEAEQFHNLLTEAGTTSALITYPGEGHGIRRMPASIDYDARVVDWFEAFMPGDKLARQLEDKGDFRER